MTKPNRFARMRIGRFVLFSGLFAFSMIGIGAFAQAVRQNENALSANDDSSGIPTAEVVRRAMLEDEASIRQAVIPSTLKSDTQLVQGNEGVAMEQQQPAQGPKRPAPAQNQPTPAARQSNRPQVTPQNAQPTQPSVAAPDRAVGRPNPPRSDSPTAVQPQPNQVPNAPAPQPNQVPMGQAQIPLNAPQGNLSIDELIKQIDPAILARLAGADVTVDVIGNQIVLQGPEDAVKAIEVILRGLDRTKGGERNLVQVVTVNERDANDIARTVESNLQTALHRANETQEQKPKISALSSNILLISARPEDMDIVLDVIQKVDAIPDPLGKIEMMQFEIKHRKASDVSKELEKVVNQIRQAQTDKKQQSRLQFIPNNISNTITVTARETERPTIQDLIDQLDVPPNKSWSEQKLTVFPLLHSIAADLAKVITDLITSSAQAKAGDRDSTQEALSRLVISRASADGKITDFPPIDVQKAIKIIPDKGTNSLIVATPEENVIPIGELIRLLDGVPLAPDFKVKLFPLRFADAETLSKALKEMFDQGKKLPEDPGGGGKGGVPTEDPGKAIVYNIGLTTDLRTNTLVVSGRPDQLSLVESVVNDLDRPATSLKFPLRLIHMDYSDATQMGKTITGLFDARIKSLEGTSSGKAAIERERIFLSTDIRTNSLVLAASQENVTEITDIIRQLDQKPAKLFDQIRIIPLVRLTSKDMKTKITDLWKRKSELRKEAKILEDLPIVVSDDRSNSLIVAASHEDMDEISNLVTSLEAQPMMEDSQLFKLEFADASVLTQMLKDLFTGLAAQSETFKAPTVIADVRSNALVVAGSRDAMEKVTQFIKRLDVEPGPLTSIFKVYSLHNASAAQLAQRMQKLFDSRSKGDSTANKTPVVVQAEESSNSVVVGASRDDQEIIRNLIDMLDKPSSLARQFEIFPLKMAKAKTVAEKLSTLFKSQGEGASGRADVIATEPDERSNSIIVWAAPSQMANVGEVINKLDTTTPTQEMMVRVIQLKQALAEDFAKLLKDTLLSDTGGAGGGASAENAVIVSFLEKTPGGEEVIRKLLRQDIKITPDARTNSLMVMAPADSMSMLVSMIKDFDHIRPVTSEVRLFPLVNSDAKTMVDQLTEIFNPKSKGEGKTQTQLVFGGGMNEAELASVGQELRFAADTRTNTLIVAGAPVYLGMVEDLVKYLDSQAREERIAEVVPTKYRKASDIAKAVQSFIKQEIDVLGTGDDQEAKIRRQERQVSVEAVGSEEKGSSNLVVGTSARQYQRTMDLIQSLDRPEPQVMLSVVVAAVTMTDQVDLGVEIAGQDLNFTDSAVVGPNGVVQGSGFDWVGGTNLGAAGSGLGLNFTVTGEDFSFLFHALQQDSRLEIMSRPILLVRNGDEGKITIADQVPIVESARLADTGQTQSTIGHQDVGIILTATPRISPDGYVTIELKQEISNISGETLQLTEGVSSPVFQKREVATNITVRDGETIVVGGLISTRNSDTENKVPILGDLPLLGPLFRQHSVREERAELLVILTADILRTDQDLHRESVNERDRIELSDSLKQNPLMAGLRITPKQCDTLGPEPVHPISSTQSPTSPSAGPAIPALKNENDQFGPKPKSYGPPLPRPQSDHSSPTAEAEHTYGPRIARTEEGDR
ncbi:MAG: hypothetical protein HY287_08095 [Planctomycetes bacterium]|nr:hypothetical protein [Planctomycetota bacterium]